MEVKKVKVHADGAVNVGTLTVVPHFPLRSSSLVSREQDTTCVVCPLCGCSVKHVAGESIHVTFQRHTETTCDPSKHPTKKARCPVKGCKEKLTSVNAYKCKDCRVDVCLKHRFAAAHECERRRLEAQQRRVVARASGALGLGVGAYERRGVAPPASLGASGDGDGGRVAGVTGSRGGRLRSGTGGAGTGARPSRGLVGGAGGASGGSANGVREVCDQCGKSFPHLAALIAHAEAAHQTRGGNVRAATRAAASGGGGTTSAGREVCPQCGLSFPDVVALVTHVEEAHERRGARGREEGGSGRKPPKSSSSGSQCLLC